jgi:hypothetical protein
MIARPLEPFSLGITFTSGGNLSFSVDQLFTYAAEKDTLDTFDSSTKLPITIGVGIGYQLSPRWVAALDVVHQPWTSVRLEGRPVSTLKNGTRLGLGFEHAGSRELNASWIDRCAYRFGATIPLSGENRIAFAFEGGQRGTTAQGLIKDTIIRFHVALLVSELWFTRPEED